MLWVILARARAPDAQVWPGRRGLALIDALVWPAAWAVFVLGLPVSVGLAGHCLLAACAMSAIGRAHRAVAMNHRYHFTTWRWGRRLLFMVLFGYSLKLAMLISA